MSGVMMSHPEKAGVFSAEGKTFQVSLSVSHTVQVT